MFNADVDESLEGMRRRPTLSLYGSEAVCARATLWARANGLQLVDRHRCCRRALRTGVAGAPSATDGLGRQPRLSGGRGATCQGDPSCRRRCVAPVASWRAGRRALGSPAAAQAPARSRRDFDHAAIRRELVAQSGVDRGRRRRRHVRVSQAGLGVAQYSRRVDPGDECRHDGAGRHTVRSEGKAALPGRRAVLVHVAHRGGRWGEPGFSDRAALPVGRAGR
jgi:hypothetical protein